ncbi:MAG: hypothetical protein KAR11_02195 [Phycisphaerae bacterium]|nr:hypothetical protein [Phycisphaerae bacterium]
MLLLAGHAKFETTQQFYLAVEDNLLGRARDAATEGFGQILAQIWHAADFEPQTQKGWQT